MIQGTHETALFEFVGKQIRRRRRHQGKTQEGLAQLIALSRTSVTNIERGRQRLPLHQLLHVADALDCELCDLLPNRRELGLHLDDEPSIDLPIVGDPTPAVMELLSRMTQR